MKTEDYAIVLDYLPTGKSSASRTEPIAQAIGKEHFTLLEVTPKQGLSLSIGEEVYLGKENRPKIDVIKGRIEFKNLTSTSIEELEDTIRDIIEKNHEKFLNFYNKSRSISIKRHQLELLPGIGTKHVREMLDEREKKPFESFKDITTRIKGVPDPIKNLVKRIMEELEGPEDKYYLFAREPKADRPQFGPNRPHFQRRSRF
jgi:putative nucleotide binding protein